MMAIDVNAFTPIEKFKKRIDKLFDTIKLSKIAPRFKEILIPGELEFRTRERRLMEGIYVPDKTWKKIEETAKKLNVRIVL